MENKELLILSIILMLIIIILAGIIFILLRNSNGIDLKIIDFNFEKQENSNFSSVIVKMQNIGTVNVTEKFYIKLSFNNQSIEWQNFLPINAKSEIEVTGAGIIFQEGKYTITLDSKKELHDINSKNNIMSKIIYL